MDTKQLKNILMNIYLKKMKSNNLKKLKKARKKWDILFLIHQMKNGN